MYLSQVLERTSFCGLVEFSARADIWETEMEDVRRNCACNNGQKSGNRVIYDAVAVLEGVFIEFN
jgi:hypothetical protein